MQMRLDATNSYQALAAWLAGLESEVVFWKTWLETRGIEFPQDYARRTQREVEFAYPSWIEGIAEPRILDVGAGLISKLGNKFGGGEIRLYACDPLAPVYASLLRHYGIHPYVKTEFALGERLLDAYQEEYFDLVNITNAIDHSIDPLCILWNMLSVCKTGGTVSMLHAKNEAVSGEYGGLHQWNVDIYEEKLFFWNKENKINVVDAIEGCAEISVCEHIGNSILVKIVKKSATLFPQPKTMLHSYDFFMASTAFLQLSPTFRALTENEKLVL